MQADNRYQGNGERGNKARPERYEYDDDQVEKGDRPRLQFKPDGGESDRSEAEDANQKMHGSLPESRP